MDFYYMPASAPCRSVLLVAKVLDLQLNLKELNLLKGEHLTPKFLKINPQHTVPTFVDSNGFALWESRAILTYLVGKYGQNDQLYPKDLEQRALVDQRLYFDIGTLYARFTEYYFPYIFNGKKFDLEKLLKIQEAFKLLDEFLNNSEYVAGKELTVADLAIIATVSTYEVMDFDLSPYKNVTKWYNKLKSTIPGYNEANGKTALEFKKFVDEVKNKRNNPTQ